MYRAAVQHRTPYSGGSTNRSGPEHSSLPPNNPSDKLWRCSSRVVDMAKAKRLYSGMRPAELKLKLQHNKWPAA
jgi:hypothetical protein